MNDKIQAIREAVIRANPEAGELKHYECGSCGADDELHYRPIRLADVLLAINLAISNSPARDDEDDDSNAEHQTWLQESVLRLLDLWNLRADNLTQQSPACIDFLYSLLTPESK